VISIDEVASGVLVNAISATGRWLAIAATSPRGRRAEELSIARWFETYRLTENIPDLPDLSAASASRLIDVLRGADVQAVVQELLAVRLTDAPETDAARAREVFAVTLASADHELLACAGPLADYYDDEICALVGRLGDSPLLAQIRSEALSGRMIAVLHAIERHTAALSTRPHPRTEADFLTRYRAHVLDQHGKLEPPDFERRRRVPIADIYVPTVICEESYPRRTMAPLQSEPSALTVWELADLIDRTVLLGDPGGGKTTASNVLMYHFASDERRRIPFLVTLRTFAAEDPPPRSVVGFIEHELETLYQCPVPVGLVDLLLLTGRAVVIFDGLDELLDTARRADVATRVERFCAEYPLAPVVVTSRVVGYEQARLDDRLFTSYRLSGFRDEDVATYAQKWFALEEGARADDADAFLAESEGIPDLRANPLLLSLMCILYRGAGSLPRNRAEIYEQCANLLLRRWDARRRIHQDLRAGHLVEPALRHLAWWLFTRANTQSAVTERELVAATAEFLHGRGFEPEDDAHDAACEFIEFCRGRMWVFSDAGITASGERLYAFTHRTFLEYFAGAQLAYDSDSPEKLARTLAPHVARGEWDVVGELAVQIKDRTSREGAKRIYETLLDERRRRGPEGRSAVLQFLSRALRSVDPSRDVTRRLTREVVGFLFSGDPNSAISGLPMAWLLASCDTCLAVVDDEIAASIEDMLASSNSGTHLNGLRLAVSLDVPLWGNWNEQGPDLPDSNRLKMYWAERKVQNILAYRKQIVMAGARYTEMRVVALRHGLITVEQALAMPGGLLALLQMGSVGIFRTRQLPYLRVSFYWFVHAPSDAANNSSISMASAQFSAVGNHLIRNPQPPWIIGTTGKWPRLGSNAPVANDRLTMLNPIAYLGAVGVLFISVESDPTLSYDLLGKDSSESGKFSDLYAYIKRRYAPESEGLLPELPVPEEFKQVFLDWAGGKIDFISPVSDLDDFGSTPTP
jgi:NACHT domain